MKKAARTALIAATGVLVILALGIGLAVTIITPNDFKPAIEAAVLRATGKELSLQGDISLAFFPTLSLEAGPAVLKDDPSFGPEAFARVEQVDASVSLMPLFSGRAEIRAISITGVRLKLAVNDKGVTNWAMPQQPKTASDTAPEQAKPGSGNAALAAVTLDALEINDTLVVYTDMRTNDSMRLAIPSFTLNALKAGQNTPPNTPLAAEAAYSIAMDSLTVANVSIKDIKASITADKGLFIAKPLSMSIAGGALAGEASVDVTEKDVRSHARGEWKAAAIGELLHAATGKASLTGRLDASWEFNATGTAWPEIAKTLGGKASINFADGSFPGFTLIPAGILGLPAHSMDLTDIRASGTWHIANGIAQTNNLVAKAAGLDATGSGNMNIPDQSLRYKISVQLPTLPQLPHLTVLPVLISGTFTSPSYTIDQPALLRDTAKSILDPTTKTGQEIQRGLRNLFER